MTEMVCDWIRRASDQAYVLIKVKAFRYDSKEMVAPHPTSMMALRAASQPRKKMARCRSCGRDLPLHQLSWQMTATMIKQLRRHLETQGRSADGAAFVLDMMATRGQQLRHSWTTGPFAVCEHCFSLYEAVSSLKLVSRTFAAVIGLPVSDSRVPWHRRPAPRALLEQDDRGLFRRVRDENEDMDGDGDDDKDHDDDDGFRAGKHARIDAHQRILSEWSVGTGDDAHRSALAQALDNARVQVTSTVEHVHAGDGRGAEDAEGNFASISLDPSRSRRDQRLVPVRAPHSTRVRVERLELVPETVSPANLCVCRLFTFFHYVANFPETLPDGRRVRSGYVKMRAFGQEACFPLSLAARTPYAHAERATPRDRSRLLNVVSMRYLRVSYFFATPQTYHRALQTQLVVDLYAHGETETEPSASAPATRIGSVQLPMDQFVSPSVFRQDFFRGRFWM